MNGARPSGGLAAPLAVPVFRRVWISSIFSNLGQQVLAVVAAWTMVQLHSSPRFVAAVQTATMLPVMLLALPAGAVADMYDKRKAAMAALLVAMGGALYLLVVSLLGLLSPESLLIGCFIVGCGVALFGPVWQSSVHEQVGREAMPAAVALYSMSSNMARSVGPAIGGLFIASIGSTVSFAITLVLYLPILIALAMWRRETSPPRLPPEGVSRAVRSGIRYIRYSSPIRRVLLRSFIASLGASAVYALLPLVAREILGQGAQTYGLLLGAFGIGAVCAITLVQPMRERWLPQRAAGVLGVASGLSILGLACSRMTMLTAMAAFAAGAAWMLTTSLYNVGVQSSTPRWVAGRALAGFQAAVAGGLALGSWIWGVVAGQVGLQPALFCAAGLLIISPLIGLFAPIPDPRGIDIESVPSINEPEIQMAINGRSGPIAIEVEYRVAEGNARAFYDTMRQNQRVLERNGAYDVSLARDLADPTIWVRRFHYATWHDYLRARDRPTKAERDLNLVLSGLQIDGSRARARRLLERPFGSVRWQDDTRDGQGSFTAGDINI